MRHSFTVSTREVTKKGILSQKKLTKPIKFNFTTTIIIFLLFLSI